MSRKRRNKVSTSRSPAIRTAAGSYSPSEKTDLLRGADGYSNAAAFLGNESPVMAAGKFIRSNLTSNQEVLSVTYRENWLATKIIDMPPEDMTRNWYTLTGDFEEEDLELLKRLEAKHSVKREITDAIRWARLYGGSIALMVIKGDEDRLEEPLDLSILMPGCFKGLLVLDRTSDIMPSLELVSDLDDPDYGLPSYYGINVDLGNGGSKRYNVHHSRILRFVGRELPFAEMQAEEYWGASELEHLWDEIQKRSATSANIAQLIFQANITTLKMDNFGNAMAMGTDKARQAMREMIAEENRFRTSYGLQLLSKDDSMENHQYSFSGISDVYEAFMMDIAGAAEIPATKLFGRSPQGFQSTGESDMRNYYETIAGLQEKHLRPALDKLLPVEAISCWGYLPDDLTFVFNPLATETPDHVAEMGQKLSDPVLKAYEIGLISKESAINELKARGENYALWTKIEASSDGKPPEEETINPDPSI